MARQDQMARMKLRMPQNGSVIRRIVILLSGLFALLCCLNVQIHAQQRDTAMAYENHNQVDPKPFKLHSIDGVATDDEGTAVVAVTVGLFAEKDHRLIATDETGSKGQFAFKNVPPGQYRIVAKHPAFCTANVPAIVVAKDGGHSRRSLQLHMKVSGIDACSFGSLQ
jgi:hypothetical protein